MTREQLNRTRAALRKYEPKPHAGRPAADSKAWADALKRTLAYYDEHDAMRAQLLRMRYIERHTEEYTTEALNICRSTYQKAQLDVLSTLAVFAAKQGARL